VTDDQSDEPIPFVLTDEAEAYFQTSRRPPYVDESDCTDPNCPVCAFDKD
jgi:hypothetical protein